MILPQTTAAEENVKIIESVKTELPQMAGYQVCFQAVRPSDKAMVVPGRRAECYASIKSKYHEVDVTVTYPPIAGIRTDTPISPATARSYWKIVQEIGLVPQTIELTEEAPDWFRKAYPKENPERLTMVLPGNTCSHKDEAFAVLSAFRDLHYHPSACELLVKLCARYPNLPPLQIYTYIQAARNRIPWQYFATFETPTAALVSGMGLAMILPQKDWRDDQYFTSNSVSFRVRDKFGLEFSPAPKLANRPYSITNNDDIFQVNRFTKRIKSAEDLMAEQLSKLFVEPTKEDVDALFPNK